MKHMQKMMEYQKKMGKMIEKSVIKWRNEFIAHAQCISPAKDENVIHEIWKKNNNNILSLKMWEQDGMTAREFIITQLQHYYISSLNKFWWVWYAPLDFRFSINTRVVCDDEWDAVGGPIFILFSKSFYSMDIGTCKE